MKRASSRPLSENGNIAPLDSRWAERFPHLSEHLAHTLWDDGEVRETSTLTVFIDEGRFKVCLNDREASASLFATGDSLEKALGSLEKALGSESGADWRAWRSKGKKRS